MSVVREISILKRKFKPADKSLAVSAAYLAHPNGGFAVDPYTHDLANHLIGRRRTELMTAAALLVLEIERLDAENS